MSDEGEKKMKEKGGNGRKGSENGDGNGEVK